MILPAAFFGYVLRGIVVQAWDVTPSVKEGPTLTGQMVILQCRLCLPVIQREGRAKNNGGRLLLEKYAEYEITTASGHPTWEAVLKVCNRKKNPQQT